MKRLLVMIILALVADLSTAAGDVSEVPSQGKPKAFKITPKAASTPTDTLMQQKRQFDRRQNIQSQQEVTHGREAGVRLGSRS